MLACRVSFNLTSRYLYRQSRADEGSTRFGLVNADTSQPAPVS